MTIPDNDKAVDRAALASLTLVAALISVNVGAAIGKSLFASVGAEGVAALRTGISALILLCVVRPWRSPLSHSNWMWLGLYGLTLGGMNLLIYWAFARIPIGIAVAIELCGPLSIVLLTSRSKKDFLWLSLAIAGLLLLVPWASTDRSLDPLGIACALGAALCWALYILFGKRASEIKGTVAVAVGMTVACVVTLPVGLTLAGTALFHGPILGLGIVIAILSSALPYLLEMRALSALSTRMFGVVTSAAPAIAALVGYLLLDETLSALQWLAVFLMIGASAGCSLTGRQDSKLASPGPIV